MPHTPARSAAIPLRSIATRTLSLARSRPDEPDRSIVGMSTAALALPSAQPLDPHSRPANDGDHVGAWLAHDARRALVRVQREERDGRGYYLVEVEHRGMIAFAQELPECPFGERDAQSLGEGWAHARGLETDCRAGVVL